MTVYAFMYYICDFTLDTEWVTEGIFSTKEKAQARANEWLENYKTTDEDGYIASIRIKEWVVM